MEFKLSTIKKTEETSTHHASTHHAATFNSTQNELFWDCSWMGGKSPHLIPKICHAHPAVIELSTGISCQRKI